MPLYAPSELDAYVLEKAAAVGPNAYVTQSKHGRLREMWCAAKFGVGYLAHVGPCAIDIAETDEQREFDFHFVVEGLRLPFQLAEVPDAGRRRGDEYRTQSVEQVADSQKRLPAQGASYAAKCIRETLVAKANHYVRAESLHILLYLNLKATSVTWPVLAVRLERVAKRFASVWLLGGKEFCCIYGGSNWPVIEGWKPLNDAT